MKKKCLIITLVMILVVCSLVSVVNASSLSVSMTPSSTAVKEATEFTVTIKISNIDAGQNGINSITSYLKYDTSVFETISESSMDDLNSWQHEFNSDTGKLIIFKTSFVKTEEEIFQITFKTKSGVTGKTGQISLSNILASNSESPISAPDIATTITVGDVPLANTNTNQNKTNTNTNVANPALTLNVNANKNKTNNTNIANVPVNGTVNSNKIGNNTNVPVNNGTSNNNIPYTGTEDVAMRAIFVVLVIAAISYFKYESMKDVK